SNSTIPLDAPTSPPSPTTVTSTSPTTSGWFSMKRRISSAPILCTTALPAPITELSIDCTSPDETSVMSELLVLGVGATAVETLQIRRSAIAPGDCGILPGLRQVVAGDLDARCRVEVRRELADAAIDAVAGLRQCKWPAPHIREIDRAP